MDNHFSPVLDFNMCEHTRNYTEFIDTKSIDHQLITQLNDPIEDTPGSLKAKIMRSETIAYCLGTPNS